MNLFDTLEIEKAMQAEIAKGAVYSLMPDEEYLKQMEEEVAKQVIEQQMYEQINVMPYYQPHSAKVEYDNSYVCNMNGIQVRRLPGPSMGHGVLGRAWLGTNTVEILDTLYGNDFLEVLLHEINHLNNPYLSESEIRQKTKREVWFQPRYH